MFPKVVVEAGEEVEAEALRQFYYVLTAPLGVEAVAAAVAEVVVAAVAPFLERMLIYD